MGAILIRTQPRNPVEGDDDANTQHEEVIQLHFRGQGPLGTVTAISDSLGQVRGTVSNPAAGVAEVDSRRVHVARALGLGELVVIRMHPAWKEPYRGVVPLVSGEIAQDIALYLNESEQTPSAMALGVASESDGRLSAGGLLIQALPGAEDAVLARIQRNLEELPPVSELVQLGANADQLLDRLLEGVGGRARSRAQPRFYCPCSHERALRSVMLLGAEELDELRATEQIQEVICEFCGERYEIDPDEIAELQQREEDG